MAEPVYESNRLGVLAKIISLGLTGCFYWLIFTSENERLWRFWIFPLFPLGVIWFPSLAAQICKEQVSTKTASRLGWIALGGLTLIPMLAFHLKEN